MAEKKNNAAQDFAKKMSNPKQWAQDQAAKQAAERFSQIKPLDLSSQIAEAKAREGGYTAPESEMLWSQMANRANAQQQMAQRQLAARQAQMGVRGGAGAAQLARQQQLFGAQKAMAGQELAIRNIDEISRRLKDRQGLEAAQQEATLGAELAKIQLEEAARARVSGEQIAAQTAAATRQKGGGGLCCFIFLEARYGDGTIDSVVRRFRDEKMTSRNRRGYYKLAQVLVPLMRKSKTVKFLTRALMTDPLVAYGKYYYGQGILGFLFKPVANFWLGLFDFLGGEHPFVRENGEVV